MVSAAAGGEVGVFRRAGVGAGAEVGKTPRELVETVLLFPFYSLFRHLTLRPLCQYNHFNLLVAPASRDGIRRVELQMVAQEGHRARVAGPRAYGLDWAAEGTSAPAMALGTGDLR